jgi:hypothetical protein
MNDPHSHIALFTAPPHRNPTFFTNGVFFNDTASIPSRQMCYAVRHIQPKADSAASNSNSHTLLCSEYDGRFLLSANLRAQHPTQVDNTNLFPLQLPSMPKQGIRHSSHPYQKDIHSATRPLVTGLYTCTAQQPPDPERSPTAYPKPSLLPTAL